MRGRTACTRTNGRLYRVGIRFSFGSDLERRSIRRRCNEVCPSSQKSNEYVSRLYLKVLRSPETRETKLSVFDFGLLEEVSLVVR